jgi:PAS domain S-box-containing protein
VDFLYLSELTLAELRDRLLVVPENSIVLYLHFSLDRTGTYYSLQDSIDAISQASPAPVYGSWDFSVKYGVMGGYVTNGFVQGHTAARMALSILSGANPSNVEIVRKSPNTYMFDYGQMERFGISESDLPQGSIVINRPFSFYEEYRLLVWSVAVVFAVLLFLVVALVGNIVRRRRMEEVLREKERRYRALFERTNDAVFILSLEGLHLSANQQAADLLGYTVEELVGTPIEQVVAPYEYADSLDKLDALLADQSLPVYERIFRRKDGTKVPVEINAALVFDSVSNPLHIQSIVRDITARKQTEEELRKHREHLEELVAERTQELKEMQAELVRKERLSALGQLTATVAHEIRNPLGTVRTAVFAIGDAVERDQLGRVERARQLAERNILRCDRIISELLDYTRERALNLEPVHVDVWLDGLLDELQIPAGIVCAKELSAGAQIPLDREQLRRAMINVVENAVDALQDEGAAGNKLTVSTRIAGERLEIQVSDTGCGIPADEMDKVFEPLFSTKSFGVGLGLPIVRNIMEQHGGGIEIQSGPGQGATVVLWLPL